MRGKKKDQKKEKRKAREDRGKARGELQGYTGGVELASAAGCWLLSGALYSAITFPHTKVISEEQRGYSEDTARGPMLAVSAQ